MARLERPVCACGCGERVRTRRARYIKGHDKRVAWVARTCPTCLKEFQVIPSIDVLRTYCSRQCRSVGRSKAQARVWNRLQRRCLEYMRAHRMTETAFTS